MAIFESAIFWIIVAAASEIIALTPLKSNSVIQLVLQALDSLKPAKKSGAIFPMTGNGYGVSIPDRITTGYIAISKPENSTQRSRISLTKQKRSGIRRSQLKTRGKLRKQEPLEKTVGLSQLLINLLKKMIESLVPVAVATVTGVAVLFNKVNHRVTQLDHRVDRLELKLVESFTTKQEFSAAMMRMEEHLIRIEDKMDKLVEKRC